MKLIVRSKPNSKKEKIQRLDDRNFFIAVKEAPVEGRANNAIIKALAKYLNLPSINVRIVSGHTSKQKIIEIS